MTITKTTIDKHGHSNSFYLLELGTAIYNDDGSVDVPDYQLRAYKDEQAKIDKFTFSDNLRPRLKMSVTKEEILAETGDNYNIQGRKALMRKAIVSVLNADDEETNLFDGGVRGVSFINCWVE